MAAFPSWGTSKALVKQYTHHLLLSVELRYNSGTLRKQHFSGQQGSSCCGGRRVRIQYNC